VEENHSSRITLACTVVFSLAHLGDIGLQSGRHRVAGWQA
jgi:hypothetical protein